MKQYSISWEGIQSFLFLILIVITSWYHWQPLLEIFIGLNIIYILELFIERHD